MAVKFLIFFIYLIYFFTDCVNVSFAKTAPEFTVAVSRKDFMEIHIPVVLWNKIIKSNSPRVPCLTTKCKDIFSKEKRLRQKINALTKSNLNKKQLDSDIVEEEGDEVLLPGAVPVNEITLDIISPSDPSDIVSAIEVKPVEEVVETVVSDVAANVQTNVKPVVKPIATSNKPGALAEGLQVSSDPIVNPLVETVLDVQDVIPAVVEAPVDAVVEEAPTVAIQATRFPCICTNGTCSCCVTVLRQKGCANVKFVPEEFAFEMDMTMNGDIVTRRKLPISDPPPICFNPRRAPFLELCARINNIHVKKQNVHMCIDIDANVGGFDLLSWNYNCLKFGNQGLATGLNPDKVTVRPPRDDDDDDDDDAGGFFSLFGGGGSDDDDDDLLGSFFDL